ncbi:MAG: branched-chain-amino-acid transaminase [Spirochaetes bacterium]|nr:branched-chain-amino-acid transaminase [Spirochaetota bacterium]
MKIYINGEYFDKENAKVSVFDHGLLYGDGIFEGIRIYNGTIFKLKEHVKRLYASAKTIFLDIPMTEKEMEEALIDAFKKNYKKEGYIRLVVTRGDGDLGIDPAKCKKANIIIIVDNISLYPKEHYENGIAVITASTQRIPPASFDVRVKSLNYLNNILAKIEARQAGVLEAIMLTSQGYVAECTADNIFIVKNNKLYSPNSFHGALEGITLNTIIKLAEKIDIKTEFATLTKYDLYNADECFFSGTGAELMPVVKIDARSIGNGKPGTLTGKIYNEFNNYIKSYAE